MKLIFAFIAFFLSVNATENKQTYLNFSPVTPLTIEKKSPQPRSPRMSRQKVKTTVEVAEPSKNQSRKIFLKPLISINLANWMAELSPLIQNKAITEIALPGSHDAATDKLTERSPLAVDTKAHKLPWVPRGTMLAWSKAQNLNIKEQLETGSRYLDLRICHNPTKNNLYSCHGFEGDNINIILTDIKEFLNAHPKEIIVLDFQHFHGVNPDFKRVLVTAITHFLSEMLIPNSLPMGLKTPLKEIWAMKKQVFVLWSDDDPRDEDRFAMRTSQDLIWTPWIWNRKKNVDSDWRNKDNTEALKADLDQVMNTPKDDSKLFVLQAQLTGNASIISKSKLPGARSRSLLDLANLAHPQYPNWIKEWGKQGHRINVFMVDFMNPRTARQIIKINYTRQKRRYPLSDLRSSSSAAPSSSSASSSAGPTSYSSSSLESF